MSHVVVGDCDIQDLDALDDGCKRLGTVELVRDQKTFKWYGQHVGDYALPAGFRADEMGLCDHAIRVVGGGPNTYEIGVCRRRDGKPGYTLLYDFWAGGHGLMQAVSEAGAHGQDCGLLMQAYSTAAAVHEAWRNGFQVQEQKLSDGSIELVLVQQ